MDKSDLGKVKEKLEKKPEDLTKGKNAREQRAKVFGTNPQPPRLSEMRIKMMRHIKNIVKDQLGVDLDIAKGKIDPKAKQLKYPLETREPKDQPYDIFTDEGVAAEKARLDAIAKENLSRTPTQKNTGMTPEALRTLKRLRAKAGASPIKRMDPKPDWRSGKLETQPSPDAAIREIAHLVLSPEGMGLGATQEDMDREFGKVIANIGFLKQKMTQGEIQPMAVENKIRRIMGLPANKQSMNPKPMSEHSRPVEQALDQPTPRFVRGVEQTKNGPKSVDLIRQTRLLSPKNAETFDKMIRGEIQYHPEKGWVPATTVNAKINQRARAAANEPDPDKYFARKDQSTLMRSEDNSNKKLEKNMNNTWFVKKPEAKAAKPKAPAASDAAPKTFKQGDATHPVHQASSLKPVMEGTPKAAPAKSKNPSPPMPKDTVKPHKSSGPSGIHSIITKVKDSRDLDKSQSKWPVPGLVPPSGKKVEGGQEPMKKEHLGFDKLKNKIAHQKNPPSDPAAVAAAIGRKKYGSKGMAAKAKAGMHKSDPRSDMKSADSLAERMARVKEKLHKGPIKDFVDEEAAEGEHSAKAINELRQFDREESQEKEHMKKSDYTANGERQWQMGDKDDHSKGANAEDKPLEKSAPKGVDKDKYESCVHDVKQQGKGYNPWAVCSASLKKMAKCMRGESMEKAEKLQKDGLMSTISSGLSSAASAVGSAAQKIYSGGEGARTLGATGEQNIHQPGESTRQNQ